MSEAGRPLNALITYGGVQGTTAAIGEAIAEGMKASGAEVTDIGLDLLAMMPNRVESAEVLGIGSPVYFLREAAYVGDFISGLPALDGKKAFVFCSSGMNRVGETLSRMQALLTERGAVVVGAAHFATAMSYHPYRKRGFGNPEHMPDESVIAAARDFGTRMAQARDMPAMPPAEVPRAARLKARLLANRSLRKFLLPGVRLNRKTCTGYGSCISRCPFGGLEREDDEAIPELTECCIQCLQCLKFCPRAAIEVDSGFKEWCSALGYRLGIH